MPCIGVVSMLFRCCLRITFVTRGTSSFNPILSFLATDILTNSCLSCELDIRDLIGINVHSTVLRKTLTLCILKMHNYSHMPPACGLGCFSNKIMLCYVYVMS